VALVAQQALTGLIPIWNQGRWRYISIEQLREGLIEQRTDFPMLPSDQSEFQVPGEVTNVYRNGLLQREGIDYSIVGGVAVKFEPISPVAGDLVTVFSR
jgi:hypothetical protein